MSTINIKLVPKIDVYETDTRNSKKRFLSTDGICIECGAIINSIYEHDCFICNDDSCKHSELITGHQIVDLRKLLDFNTEDLKALSELNGCTGECGKSKIVIKLIKTLHLNLDKRIDCTLIRKICLRNRRRFWFCGNIADEIHKYRKPKIQLIDAKDVINEEIHDRN